MVTCVCSYYYYYINVVQCGVFIFPMQLILQNSSLLLFLDTIPMDFILEQGA